MNTATVRKPESLMKALSEYCNTPRLRAAIHAINASKLRYPLLMLTFLLLTAVMITARQLAVGILADIQAVWDVLNASL
jgi:hypothetical protein